MPYKDPEKHRAAVAAWKRRNREKMTSYNSGWRELNPEAQKMYSRRYRAKHPRHGLKSKRKHVKAWNAVGTAVANGTVKETPCVVCGAAKIHKHHPDYSQPLKVVCLCSRHHRMVHLGMLSLI